MSTLFVVADTRMQAYSMGLDSASISLTFSLRIDVQTVVASACVSHLTWCHRPPQSSLLLSKGMFVEQWSSNRVLNEMTSDSNVRLHGESCP